MFGKLNRWQNRRENDNKSTMISPLLLASLSAESLESLRYNNDPQSLFGGHSASSLAQFQRRMKGIEDSILEGLCFVDANWIIESVNENCSRIIGCKQEDCQGKDFFSVFRLQSSDNKKGCLHSAMVEHFQTHGKIYRNYHCSIESSRGESVDIQLCVVPIWQQKHLSGLLISFVDLKRMREMFSPQDNGQVSTNQQQELEYYDKHDKLTGLFNRNYYNQH